MPIKEYVVVDVITRRCPRIPSAKASSVWNTRNDSSNVSSLLAPDSHLVEDKSDHSTATRTILSKSRQQRRCIRSALTPKRREELNHCEDCYCRESPTIPTFSSKIRCTHENTVKLTNVRRSIPTIGHQSRTYGVKRIPTHPEEIKIFENKSTGRGSTNKLSYTHTRSDYETKSNDFRRIDEPGDHWRIDEAISKFNEAADIARASQPGGEERIDGAGAKSTSDELGERSETPEIAQDTQKNINLSGTGITYKDFKDLARFRKDNYFDCHSSEHTAPASSQEHKCIHKFVINDRFLPQPLNTDSFGISRCDVCNKPMELYKSEKPRVETKQKSVNKLKQVYEYNLTPPRINIGRGNETVQIKVPEKLGNECLMGQSPNFKITRKVPGNSYALRYQRGRI